MKNRLYKYVWQNTKLEVVFDLFTVIKIDFSFNNIMLTRL